MQSTQTFTLKYIYIIIKCSTGATSKLYLEGRKKETKNEILESWSDYTKLVLNHKKWRKISHVSLQSTITSDNAINFYFSEYVKKVSRNTGWSHTYLDWSLDLGLDQLLPYFFLED